ncbi:MAG: hypothetical protein L6R40_001167 [Gallowayella cf. fulva]|nr:MAG: hypothetical protein L6R40_001167 [Xanthomendoza cf. fulva]
MTPKHFHDHPDLQNKSPPYFLHSNSREHGQYLYTNMQQVQQSPLVASSYHHYQRDMANMEMGNGVSPFNQQAMMNLPPPLPYPNPEPMMTAPPPTKAYLPPMSPSITSKPAPREKPPSQSASTQTNSSASPTIASNTPTPTKKKFPCPHAVRHNCSDTFTTSGHAARHGKKHTGEKSVVCPTCKKAFTRKDNMKQHERTHKNTASRDLTDDNAFSHATTSRPPRDGRSDSPSVPESTPSATTENSEFNFASTPQMHRSEHEMMYQSTGRTARTNGRISTGSGRSEEDGEGESPGLDALAAAAIMG